jgi:hypothetical protein
MKPFAIAALVLLAACASTSPTPQSSTTAVPGHGALTIQILPNPVVATKASGDMYEFPFEVVLRETGGRSVNVNSVTADVNALGAIHIATETYDAARIRTLGYSTTVPANGELRYRFNPRRGVSDDRLFGGVAADIRVDGVDDAGTPTTARTTVTVTR